MNDQKNLKKITDDEGNALSPILPKDIKNYLIDIDGTVTEDVPNEEPERMLTCEPYPDAITEVLNDWYEEPHNYILHFSNRGSIENTQSGG